MSSIRAVASAAALFAMFSRCAAQCSVQDGVKVTFFGYPDNGPPEGSESNISCGWPDLTADRGESCGGTGYYWDPITFATAYGEFNMCEIIYAPYLQKYLIYQGSCEQCNEEWDDSGIYHIDIWVGNDWDGGDNQIICEKSLTPGDLQSIVRNPDPGLNVDPTALYDSNGNCNNGNTYDGKSAWNYCSGGSGDSSGSSSGPSSCSWGCAGWGCQTYNDCADPLNCNNGVCG